MFVSFLPAWWPLAPTSVRRTSMLDPHTLILSVERMTESEDRRGGGLASIVVCGWVFTFSGVGGQLYVRTYPL